MSRSLQVHPRVTAHLRQIYSYREAERNGSGEEFLITIQELYQRIASHPFRFQKRKGEIRHAHLQRMKYRMAFKVHKNDVIILEIRHTSRKPSRYGP